VSVAAPDAPRGLPVARPLALTPRADAARRPRRRRRRRALGALGALIIGAAATAGGAIALRPAPLPIPAEIFPADGVLTAIDLPRGAVAEVDAAVAALVASLPAHLEYAGAAADIPALSLLGRSGPWRAALWQAPAADAGGERRCALFIGGEAAAALRGRAAEAAARHLAARGIAARAAGGGLVLGSDAELVRACAERAEIARRRPVERSGVAFWRDDAVRGAAVQLWWAPGASADRLLERWRGEEGALPWREWLLDHGVAVVPISEAAGERLWELRGAREAFADLARAVQRW
jgi:hypothetical protein